MKYLKKRRKQCKKCKKSRRDIDESLCLFLYEGGEIVVHYERVDNELARTAETINNALRCELKSIMKT